MKKVRACLLAVICILSVIGCGKKSVTDVKFVNFGELWDEKILTF